MLKLRDQHVKALTESSLGRFEAQLAAHLREHFPAKCGALGEAGLRQEIEQARKKAASHGFQTEREICLFTDLCFAFGHDFDSNPRYPWATSILKDRSYPNSLTRMEKLYEVAESKGKEAQKVG